jgi:hypothetical protein
MGGFCRSIRYDYGTGRASVRGSPYAGYHRHEDAHLILAAKAPSEGSGPTIITARAMRSSVAPLARGRWKVATTKGARDYWVLLGLRFTLIVVDHHGSPDFRQVSTPSYTVAESRESSPGSGVWPCPGPIREPVSGADTGCVGVIRCRGGKKKGHFCQL